MLELIKCDTFWSAVSALATVAGAAAVFLAVRQLRFDAWLKAQDIWVSDNFTADRSKIFSRIDNLEQPWTSCETEIGLNVCQRVDEFVRLVRYLGKRRMLTVWGAPLAKAWLVLEPIVLAERKKTGEQTKWDAFEKMGKKALSTRPHLRAKQKGASGSF